MSEDPIYKKPGLNESLFQAITKQSGEGISLADTEGDYIFVNKAFCKMTGYSETELIKMNVRDLLPFGTEISLFSKVVEKQSGFRELELMKKDGSHFLAEIKGYPIELNDQNFVLGIVRDITELNKYRYHLEELVVNRTNELKQQTIHLEEANVALKVLLEQRKKDKEEIEKNIYNNIEKLVYPYLEKLKEIISESEGITYLDIIKSNLTEITSVFFTDFFQKLSKLTPAEIEVADLIRRGKATKEIAQLLKLAPETIASHRKNIRKKLALTNKKMNLKTVLTTSQK